MTANEYQEISHELDMVCAALFTGDRWPDACEHVSYKRMGRNSGNYRYQRFRDDQQQQYDIYVHSIRIASASIPRHKTLYRVEAHNEPESTYVNLLDKIMFQYPEVIIKDD